GDHDEVVELEALEVAGEDGRGVQVIHGDVEEALDLVLMEVDGDHPVGTGGDDEVGDELRADRDAGLVLPILTAVAEVRDDGGHAGGGRAPSRVDQEEQLHDRVGRGARRLDDEDVAAPGVAVDPDEDLAVRELLDGGAVRRFSDLLADFRGEGPIRAAAQQEKWPPPVGVVHVLGSWEFGSGGSEPEKLEKSGGGVDVAGRRRRGPAVAPPAHRSGTMKGRIRSRGSRPAMRTTSRISYRPASSTGSSRSTWWNTTPGRSGPPSSQASVIGRGRSPMPRSPPSRERRPRSVRVTDSSNASVSFRKPMPDTSQASASGVSGSTPGRTRAASTADPRSGGRASRASRSSRSESTGTSSGAGTCSTTAR